ncbi:hypothetical protein [Desulfogranum marinum]|uniref:hypothetical protein n=1 Tax=Desulfogranum marinum TaxID=453220 RepID=UPI001965EB52|nr:hypothetical protein [Desulfogranum marinum]MBM9512370.1 hypothetical protein [Desulfogranum marinum]
MEKGTATFFVKPENIDGQVKKGQLIMLHGKGEPLSKMAELLEIKENKMATGACAEIAIISTH